MGGPNPPRLEDGNDEKTENDSGFGTGPGHDSFPGRLRRQRHHRGAADDTAGQTTEEPADNTESESDLAYVQDKGTLVVGITYFAPLDYKEEGSDEWSASTPTWPRPSLKAWA